MPSKNLLRDARILRRLIFDRVPVEEIAREFYLPRSTISRVRDKRSKVALSTSPTPRHGTHQCHAVLVANAANRPPKCPHCRR